MYSRPEELASRSKTQWLCFLVLITMLVTSYFLQDWRQIVLQHMELKGKCFKSLYGWKRLFFCPNSSLVGLWVVVDQSLSPGIKPGASEPPWPKSLQSSTRDTVTEQGFLGCWSPQHWEKCGPKLTPSTLAPAFGFWETSSPALMSLASKKTFYHRVLLASLLFQWVITNAH